MRRRTILIVDDEPKIVRFIGANLEASGYETLTAPDGRSALDQLGRQQVDLVLLDVMLPDMSGFEVLREIRRTLETPVIIVTAKGDPRDAVAGLELGADDYVAKPFNVEELLARVAAVFRRTASRRKIGEPAAYDDGTLALDPGRRQVSVDGEPVSLTPTEFEVLVRLVGNRDRVLTHEELLGAVWGPEYREETHYLRVVMARLRQKLHDGESRTSRLQTVPRVGYQFRPGPMRQARGPETAQEGGSDIDA